MMSFGMFWKTSKRLRVSRAKGWREVIGQKRRAVRTVRCSRIFSVMAPRPMDVK